MPPRRRSDAQAARDRADSKLLEHAATYLRDLVSRETYSTNRWITEAGYKMGALLQDIARAVSTGDVDAHVRSGALAVAKELSKDENPPRSTNTIPSY